MFLTKLWWESINWGQDPEVSLPVLYPPTSGFAGQESKRTVPTDQSLRILRFFAGSNLAGFDSGKKGSAKSQAIPATPCRNIRGVELRKDRPLCELSFFLKWLSGIGVCEVKQVKSHWLGLIILVGLSCAISCSYGYLLQTWRQRAWRRLFIIRYGVVEVECLQKGLDVRRAPGNWRARVSCRWVWHITYWKWHILSHVCTHILAHTMRPWLTRAPACICTHTR